MAEEIGRELGWEDPIENDGPDFTILPEGDYDFEVLGFERGRHAGSDKLPACNKAILKIKLTGPEDSTTLDHNLFLHTKTEGILCAFFNAIGQRKHGEKMTMNWNKVVGSKGRCKVVIDTWIGSKDGREMKNNKIQKFYDYEPPQQAQTPTFIPGSF
jgi:hypothetical protein